jgi:2-methylcitrate dehydratase PrpD
MLAAALGSFVANIDSGTLPKEALESIKLRVLDTLGVGVAGAQLGLSRPLIQLFDSVAKVSHVWGLSIKASVREAAMANCFATHGTYLEDGSRFTGGHPSCVVIPPVFAQAEVDHCSGSEVIASVSAGYEVFLRLGRDTYPANVGRGFQPTAILAAVASAAGMARLLKLSPQTAADALAIAANLGVGMKEALKTSASQPLQVARGCEGGVMAALLAKAGMHGAPEIFEKGFLPAFGGSSKTSTTLLGLGTEYRISETYLKRHAGCRGNHAPLDVALELVTQEQLDLVNIKLIRIKVDTVTLAASIEAPINAEQAQFSISFSVAVALLYGNASIFQYTEKRLNDLGIREAMAKIDVEADPSLDVGYPEKRAALIEIELFDGKTYKHSVDNARGEPEWPLKASEIVDKFFAHTDEVLGSRAQAIHDLVMDLENVRDVAEIGKLLTSINN